MPGTVEKTKLGLEDPTSQTKRYLAVKDDKFEVQNGGGSTLLEVEKALLTSTSGKKIAYGYEEELTDATAKTVATGLSVVEVVIAIEGTEAATPGSKILANKSATAGSIELTAKGATGTTKVHWVVIGT